MSPLGRAAAIALLLALVAPAGLAQTVEGVPGPQGEPPTEEVEPETPDQFQCQAPLESCLPDLIASNPDAAATDERFPVKPCADYVNLGEAPSATPFRYLLSIDGIPVGEEQVSGAYQRGEGDSVCWGEFFVPVGRHTMTVHVDAGDEVPESDETNNVRSVSFLVRAAPKVDLHLSTLRVTPTEGGAGVNQLFFVNVSNAGTATSPPSAVSLTDTTGGLANWSVPPLSPGQTWMAVHATRPEYRPVGTFVARAVVDPLNNVSELSEENNEALIEYSVLEHPAPDYDLLNVSVSGNRTELRGVRIDVDVMNSGDRAVRGNLVRIVNETNVTLAQGLTRSILFPGDHSNLQFFLALRAGVHHLRAIADPRAEVIERNESNNEWSFTIEIEEAAFVLDLPNLIVERVYAMPEDPRPGEAVSVGALVHNIGTNRSAATRVNFLVDDELIGTASVPALVPDAFYSAYIPWIPTTAGAYNIVAVADQSNAIEELDEIDNALALDFLVTTQRPPETTPPPAPTVPPPTTTPTPEPTAPTPTTPTPTTPTTPADTASRVLPGELIVATSPAPGGATGVFSISLRNPTIERIGLLTVNFKVDGQPLKEVLVQGISGAGTVAATTGQVAIPAGAHKVTAEVRIVGTGSAPPVVREASYTQEAGEKGGVPGFEAIALLLVLAAIAVVRRR